MVYRRQKLKSGKFNYENQIVLSFNIPRMSLEADLLSVCKYHGYKTCHGVSTDLTRLGTLCEMCSCRVVAMLTSHEGTVTTNNAAEFNKLKLRYPVSMLICVTDGDYANRFGEQQ